MLKKLEGKLINKSIWPTVMRLLVLDFLSEISALISLIDLESAFERPVSITYRTLNLSGKRTSACHW